MIFLTLVFLVLSTTANSPFLPQTEVNQEKLKQQAQELSDAVLNSNFARAADLTFPKLVRLLGGRAQYMATLEKGMKEVQSDRFRISSIVVGEPRDILKVNRNYYAIVPNTMRMQVSEGELVGEGFMIGISTDGGQNWTFVDSGSRSMDKTSLATLFGPKAAAKLRIPEVKRPVLYRKN